MTDSQSRHMLDLVVDGFMVDAAWIYMSNLALDYPPSFRYMIAEKDQSFSSNHESRAKKIQIGLKMYKTEFESKNIK